MPLWSAGAEPSLEIGVVDGALAYQFEDIASVRVRADGTLLVADRGAREIRFFDPAGRHLRTVGGRGRGPGEFEGLSRLFLLPGDSVAAWDANQRRLTVFGADGVVARTETLELPGFGARLDAVFADGALVARPGLDPFQMRQAPEGPRRLPVTHLLRAPGSAVWQPLEGFPGLEETVSQAGGTGTATRPLLFGRSHVAAAGRRRWYTGDTDRFEVTVRAPDGAPIHLLRREHTPVQVTANHVAHAHAEFRAGAERNRVSLPFGNAGGGMPDDPPPHRETMPAFDEVVEDLDENVWVRHYHFPPDQPQRWSVFSPDGELIAEAETPAGVRVQQIGPDWIAGIATDELGVGYVRVHPLVRR